MDKRRPKRTHVSLGAKLVSRDNSYEGFIMNLSDDGVYVVTAPTKTSIDFIPGNPLKVQLQTHSGETLNLHCEVEWLHIHKTPPHGLTNSMGVKIIDTPPEYKEFFIFKTLE